MTDIVLAGTSRPRPLYWVIMALLGAAIAWAVIAWIYQVRSGMGVSGLSIPVAWAFYITNFVFWIGIGHAGTLISAILHLVRSRWRTAISRAAEAMTIFAVFTAGLFPLIHLGRLWVFWFILPYPSERQLWPNFTSPLVWDVCAVSTYLTVSIIFWFVGIVPDLAAARDRAAATLGPSADRAKFYRRFALGWTGAVSQWRHFGRSYLFFAALATPLVVSVHSVVSFDFSMANLPGWHTTIFAPYFVAGAIHSGLAMVITLLIPLRRMLKLERLITIDHFEAMAKTTILTAAIVGYAYFLEPFIAWYSGDRFETQFAWWRATGWIAAFYWLLILCNVLIPLMFLVKRWRRNIWMLLFVGVAINVGMWLERFVIIAGSTSHDFMPHNWHKYAPTWVELSITFGAFSFFMWWFLGFAKLMPTVAMADVKELESGMSFAGEEDTGPGGRSQRIPKGNAAGVLAVFGSPRELIEALKHVTQSPFKHIEAFSPFRLEPAESILYPRKSPVRYWTLTGALLGATGGLSLAIGSSMVNALIVGGKYTPITIIPYCIVGFEGLILLGTLFNLTGMIVHARLGRSKLPAIYDPRFSRDKFGILIACDGHQAAEARRLLEATKPEEVRVYE